MSYEEPVNDGYKKWMEDVESKRGERAEKEKQIGLLKEKYSLMSKDELVTSYKVLLRDHLEKALLAGATMEQINLMPPPENSEMEIIFDRLHESEELGDYFSGLQDEVVEELRRFPPEKPKAEEEQIVDGNLDKTVEDKSEIINPHEKPKIPTETAEFLKENIISSDLSYQDADIPEQRKAGMLKWSKESPSASRYAESIVTLAQGTSLNEIRGKAEELKNQLLKIASTIGVPVSAEAQSLSWAMWDIGKQYYYFIHQNEADPKYEIAEPLESKEKQEEIVNRHLGYEAYRAFNSNSEWKKKIEKDNRFTRALELLNKKPKQDGQLSSYDFAELGKRLREI